DLETKNPASQLGMTDVPAPESPGGVIAFGLIERTTIIALSGLRSLVAFGEGATSEGTSETLTQAVPDNKTLALRRYLFALALAAAPEPGIWDLREGCILVQNSKPPAGNLAPDQTALTSALVKHNGEHKPFSVPPEKEAEKYLEEAAKEFFGDAGPKSLSLAFDPSGA